MSAFLSRSLFGLFGWGALTRIRNECFFKPFLIRHRGILAIEQEYLHGNDELKKEFQPFLITLAESYEKALSIQRALKLHERERHTLHLKKRVEIEIAYFLR